MYVSIGKLPPCRSFCSMCALCNATSHSKLSPTWCYQSQKLRRPWLFLTGSEWRLRAAAALGINLHQLPPSKSALKRLLKAAAAAYPSKILAAARSSGHCFSAQDPAILLGRAVNTGSKQVVAAVLATFPESTWTLAVMDSSLSSAAQIRHKPSIFKLLVQAAVAAEDAAASTATAQKAPASDPATVESAMEGSDEQFTGGRMSAALLEAVLLHAAEAYNIVLVEWVLKQEQPCWNAEMVEPSISAVAGAGAGPDMLEALLQHTSFQWSNQELADILDGFLDDMESMEVVLGAAADEWTAEQLAPLVEYAAEMKEEAAVVALVQKYGVTWCAEDLEPAAKCVAESCSSSSYPYMEEPTFRGWHMDLDEESPPTWNHARVMGFLLGAARGQWTEAQLAQLLLPAVEGVNREVVRVVLRQFVGGWSSQQLWPAVQLAWEARSDERIFDVQFTLVDLVKAARGQWTAEQLRCILWSAAGNCWWGALQGLVGVQGVALTAEEVQAMAAEAGDYVCNPEDVLKYSSMCESDACFFDALQGLDDI